MRPCVTLKKGPVRTATRLSSWTDAAAPSRHMELLTARSRGRGRTKKEGKRCAVKPLQAPERAWEVRAHRPLQRSPSAALQRLRSHHASNRSTRSLKDRRGQEASVW